VIGNAEKPKEKQFFSDKQHLLIWYLSVWDEIVGVLQDIFISDTSCRLLFLDGVNIYIPLPDNTTLQRLQSSIAKFIGICRTDVPARRYLFNFNEGHSTNNHSTSIHHKSEGEIDALKVLNGWHGSHGLRKPWAKSNGNQRQLYAWMGGS